MHQLHTQLGNGIDVIEKLFHGHSGVRFPTALAVGGKPANPLCQEKT